MGDYGRSLWFGVMVDADARGYEEAPALVRCADEAGLDLVGVPDHAYNRGLLDTLSFMAALVPRTERVRLFTVLPIRVIDVMMC